MICVIVTCALVAGSAKECTPDTMSAYYIEAPKVIKDRAECLAAFKTAPMASERRKVRHDVIPTTADIMRGK
jgi:hypothetical protein